MVHLPPRQTATPCVAPVSGRIVLSDPAREVRTLPGGKVLSLIHKGSSSMLHEAWSRLGAYAGEREYAPNGLPRGVELNDPHDPGEEDLLTEIQIPVDPAARKPQPGAWYNRNRHFSGIALISRKGHNPSVTTGDYLNGIAMA